MDVQLVVLLWVVDRLHLGAGARESNETASDAVNHHPFQVMLAARAGGTFKSSPEPGKKRLPPVGR
jgi:hypothetical protein